MCRAYRSTDMRLLNGLSWNAERIGVNPYVKIKGRGAIKKFSAISPKKPTNTIGRPDTPEAQKNVGIPISRLVGKTVVLANGARR